MSPNSESTESKNTLPTFDQTSAKPSAVLEESSAKCGRGLLILLFLICFGTYLPALGFDFVNWDDTWYVLRNPYIKSWAPGNLWDISSEVINRNYAPVTIFTYLIEHSLWGTDPAGYHAVNVLLHSINAVLVCVLVTQLTKLPSVGWMTALLFAVHPVHVESVAWVSSMKGLLCGTFMLACCICWMRPHRTESQSNWGMFWFVLAVLSKALTVVLPAIILLYDLLICRRRFSEALPRQFVPGLLALWVLLKTMAAQGASTGGIRSHLALSKLQILGIDTVILWDYVGMLFWPSDLAVLYDYPTTGLAIQIGIASCSWGLVAWSCWKFRHRCPLIVFAVCTWILLLLPVLNFSPITTLINDRYLYMPSIPFLGAVCFGIFFVWRGLTTRLMSFRIRFAKTLTARQAWLAVPVSAGMCLIAATRSHLPVWQNDRSLWEYTMTQSSSLPVVRIQYAMMLHQSGQTNSAISELEQTLVGCETDAIDRQRIAGKLAAWKNGDAERGGIRIWRFREATGRHIGEIHQ